MKNKFGAIFSKRILKKILENENTISTSLFKSVFEAEIYSEKFKCTMTLFCEAEGSGENVEFHIYKAVIYIFDEEFTFSKEGVEGLELNDKIIESFKEKYLEDYNKQDCIDMYHES